MEIIPSSTERIYKTIRVIKGDCKEICKNLQEFDHLITDPPYKISRENNYDTHPKGGVGVHYGEWDVNHDPVSWIKLIAPLIKCSVILFGSIQNIGFIIEEFEKNGFVYKRPITIRKSNPVPFNMDRMPSNHLELGAWLVRENVKWIFNSDGKQIILDFCVPCSRGKFHPNQKNPEMMSKLIGLFTDTGDSILDCFAGSGQTLIEASKLGRISTGVELMNQFYNMINNRIVAELPDELSNENTETAPKYSFV